MFDTKMLHIEYRVLMKAIVLGVFTFSISVKTFPLNELNLLNWSVAQVWHQCMRDLAGMCNPKNYSDTPATSKSTVEELYRPIPSLFRALTEGEAPINMMVVSFPVAEELSYHENLVSFLETMDDQHQNISLPGNSIHATYDTSQGM